MLMRTLSPILCALLVAGCAGFDDRSHGSWLDAMGRTAARGDLSAEAAKDLAAQVGRLRAEAEVIRISMAHEGDRVKRIAYLRQLEAIGDRLRPLEQALRQGGYPAPAEPAAPPGAA